MRIRPMYSPRIDPSSIESPEKNPESNASLTEFASTPTPLPTHITRPVMFEFFRDLWRFLRARRKWFLLPIILLLLLLGILLITAEGSAVGAFVYTLF